VAKQQRFDPSALDRAKGTAPGKAATSKSAKKKNPGRSGRPGGRPPAEERPATLGTWISAARPQTLALAVGPVVLGTGAAALLMDSWWDHWVRALLCLAVAVLLQIGVNYANDYSDGIRGTDAHRVGPARLVGSGRAKPKQVLTVALVFFGLAALAGLALVVLTQHWWLLAVGAVAIAAAWFYTGGKRPYGYAALGEVAVFLFFGIVAVAGTTFVQVATVNIEAWIGGVIAGLFAAAVLHVNNLRDREQDRLAGKRTVAVLLGDLGSRILFGVLALLPFALLAFYVIFYANAGYVYFALLAAAPAVLIVSTSRSSREYVTALKLTLFAALAFEVGLGAVLGLALETGTELLS